MTKILLACSVVKSLRQGCLVGRKVGNTSAWLRFQATKHFSVKVRKLSLTEHGCATHVSPERSCTPLAGTLLTNPSNLRRFAYISLRRKLFQLYFSKTKTTEAILVFGINFQQQTVFILT